VLPLIIKVIFYKSLIIDIGDCMNIEFGLPIYDKSGALIGYLLKKWNKWSYRVLISNNPNFEEVFDINKYEKHLRNALATFFSLSKEKLREKLKSIYKIAENLDDSTYSHLLVDYTHKHFDVHFLKTPLRIYLLAHANLLSKENNKYVFLKNKDEIDELKIPLDKLDREVFGSQISGIIGKVMGPVYFKYSIIDVQSHFGYEFIPAGTTYFTIRSTDIEFFAKTRLPVDIMHGDTVIVLGKRRVYKNEDVFVVKKLFSFRKYALWEIE